MFIYMHPVKICVFEFFLFTYPVFSIYSLNATRKYVTENHFVINSKILLTSLRIYSLLVTLFIREVWDQVDQS